MTAVTKYQHYYSPVCRVAKLLYGSLKAVAMQRPLRGVPTLHYQIGTPGDGRRAGQVSHRQMMFLNGELQFMNGIAALRSILVQSTSTQFFMRSSSLRAGMGEAAHDAR